MTYRDRDEDAFPLMQKGLLSLSGPFHVLIDSYRKEDIPDKRVEIYAWPG